MAKKSIIGQPGIEMERARPLSTSPDHGVSVVDADLASRESG